MQLQTAHIANSLIPETDQLQNLKAVFRNAILLDGRFKILGVGVDLLHLLNYTEAQLLGRSLEAVAENLDGEVQKKIDRGYFDEFRVALKPRQGGRLVVGLSGFYLGFIADANDVIVLRTRNIQPLIDASEELEAKVLELDKFVYKAAHDLRGPLATIKGLINLGLKEADPETLKFILTQLAKFSDNLDKKLYKLILNAEFGQDLPTSNSHHDIHTLESRLKLLMSEGAGPNQIQFSFHSNINNLVHHDIVSLESVCMHLLIFIRHMPHSRLSSVKIHFEEATEASKANLKINVYAEGFGFDPMWIVLFTTEVGYADLLSNPDLLTISSFQRSLLRLKGTIQVAPLPTGASFEMTIPLLDENLVD